MSRLLDQINERRFQEAEDYLRRADEAKASRDYTQERFLRSLAQKCLDAIS